MDPIRCVKGCGFFRSAKNNNMCSKCYKDFEKTETIISKPIAAVDRPDDDNNSGVSNLTANLEGLTMEKKKNRCKNSNKKVGLLGFQCLCGGLFCGRHRMPELHTCEADYKTISNASKVNPHLVLVKADNLDQRV